MTMLLRFLAPVEGAIKGYLNFEELYRAILTSLVAGSVVALLFFLVRAILGHFAEVLPGPSLAALVVMNILLDLDLLRRMSHGADVVLQPVIPSRVPATIPPAA